MNEELLLPFFSEFGPVAELTVIRDKINQTHKGTDVWDTLKFLRFDDLQLLLACL
jgi:RNA recognition motif-containing protein